ncbi:hypothetical protein GRJ2_000383700 [Grus japonensis]|uniref:Endonuclease/exonuclease/phosphatase domain-containing protein n=1 Tax=Grus japonensis TaxID=30415 RepID=A0ABC9W2V8_GRUJA
MLSPSLVSSISFAHQWCFHFCAVGDADQRLRLLQTRFLAVRVFSGLSCSDQTEQLVATAEDRQGRQGGGIALYVNDQLECMELHLGMDEELTESLWVRIKGRAGAGHIIVGVCYRPPDQGDRADEALYRQMEAASHSQALVLMGDFNHPDICWRDNAAERKQSRKFLECVHDNFLLQVIEEPTRRGAMLDLILTNKEGLVGDVKLKGSLGCSDHEMVEFRILRAARRAHSKLTTLDFRRADFGLFRDLLGRIPWDKALEGRGAQDSWLIFKGHLLQAQE